MEKPPLLDQIRKLGDDTVRSLTNLQTREDIDTLRTALLRRAEKWIETGVLEADARLEDAWNLFKTCLEIHRADVSGSQPEQGRVALRLPQPALKDTQEALETTRLDKIPGSRQDDNTNDGRKTKMEENRNGKLQIVVSLGGGVVTEVQIFRSEESAQKFWDASIEEAKKHVEYEKLSAEEQKEFDRDPFGFAYGGDKDLVWEEAAARD